MKKLSSSIIATIFLYFILVTSSFATSKTLKVGLTADYPPFEFTKHGQLQGFSIDFAKKLGEALNREIEFYDMSFNSLIPALQSRKIDIIISSMTITEERKKNVDFSLPYYSSIFSILSLKSSKITSVDQLKDKIVGVQLGSTMADFAKNNSTDFSFKVISLDSNLTLIQELNKKIIDALIVEKVQAAEYSKHNPNIVAYAIPEQYYKDAQYSVVVRKGSLTLEDIDSAIKKFYKDGTIEKLKQKWIK
jgi:polar amino acid transport system substrate-binding protein